MNTQFDITTFEKLRFAVKEIIAEKKYNIILLKGNLGAGKTTFTQEFCKQLNVEDEVSSPTYSIVNEYHYPKGKIFHFDLYRLKNLNEAFEIGIWEYIDSQQICIIEWPEIFEHELIENYHLIEINYQNHNRTLKFSSQ